MSPKNEKKHFFEDVKQQIKEKNFKIVDTDWERPWGGFFVIDEDQAANFGKEYFSAHQVQNLDADRKLSPKILVVQPKKRLSWQYHHRRAEIWTIVKGPVGVITSDTNEQGPLKKHPAGDTVTLKQGERHRLVGLDDWGIVAEIWQHTDSDHPSNEEDIVRVQDDFGR